MGHVKLSGGPDRDERAVEELRQKNEELLRVVSSLESQLRGETAAKEESMKEYQHYVNRLQSELVDSRSKVSFKSKMSFTVIHNTSDVTGQEVQGVPTKDKYNFENSLTCYY